MTVKKRVREGQGSRRERPGTIFVTDLSSPPHPTLWAKFLFFWRVQLICIVKIWWQVVLVTLYTAGIVCLNKYWPIVFYMEWTPMLVPILGVVTGLLLVFRTNTAYDRYYEGRRLWSNMIQGIRTLSRWIWILVKEENGNDVLEKKSAINLLLAYAVACKHYLREEYSYEYDDLRPLIGHLPKMFKEPKVKHKTHNSSAINYAPPTNIPLQISYYIGIYIDSVRKKEKWDTSVSGMLLTALNSLVDCLSGFERIKRTPIPLSYSVHLYHVIWLYIFSLPFQLIAGLDWWTIPAVCLCSFTFIGILHIGSEIEDPFGFGANDLPLDDLCKVLSTEMRDIMGTVLPTSEELYLSDEYFPIEGSALPSRALARKTVVEFKTLLNQVIDTNQDEDEEERKQNQSEV